jgi:arginyl-tRNA--protein-N-Asp/Glu arginylyltransferase
MNSHVCSSAVILFGGRYLRGLCVRYNSGMESLFRYVAPPSQCSYLPAERASMEYELVANLSAQEYQERLSVGWRRFGAMMFRPRCRDCKACQSLRVDVARFRANRSQRRAWKANQADVQLRIGPPSVTNVKLRLYDRFHAHQADLKGWPDHPAKDAGSYRESFVNNPSFTEEWCYYLPDNRLIGVGYVDRLPDSMSAIYFFYDPDARERSLGTYNVLCLLEDCALHDLPYLYLGYYVEGCRSLEYKGNFTPNQVLLANGAWHDFLP